MTTIVPSKTWGTSHHAWQDIASAAQVVGASIDVATKRAISFDIRLGRLTASAFTAGWPNVRIEAQAKTGTGQWTAIYAYQMALGASISSTTANGAISANASSFVVTSATNIAIGDILFLGHTTTPANYELVRVKSFSGTTITPEENVVNAHDTGSVISDQAEMLAPVLDVTAYAAVRVVLDNANSGQGIKAQVLYTTYDSDTF